MIHPVIVVAPEADGEHTYYSNRGNSTSYSWAHIVITIFTRVFRTIYNICIMYSSTGSSKRQMTLSLFFLPCVFFCRQTMAFPTVLIRRYLLLRAVSSDILIRLLPRSKHNTRISRSPGKNNNCQTTKKKKKNVLKVNRGIDAKAFPVTIRFRASKWYCAWSYPTSECNTRVSLVKVFKTLIANTFYRAPEDVLF